MASVKLPWELEEEILSRLPCRSLVRFRSVCKNWNGLFNDKSFLDKQLSHHPRPQFILLTESKIYSIEIDLGVDPKIELCEIPYDFPFKPMKLRYTSIASCDGLLICDFWRQGTAVWNPWLRQVEWIEYKDKSFCFCGVGYDTSKCYKILGYFTCFRRVSDSIEQGYDRFAIYECASQVLKFIDAPFTHWFANVPLSVNGNLYWVSNNPDSDSDDEYIIESFDFSTEIFKSFCLLACQHNYSRSKLVLAVFKGDRFSLLKQCYETSKIEIWVTKKKIIDDDREQVVWTNFMTLPTTNLPKLLHKICGISYFIFEDKTLIMCLGDEETGAACIFVVREDMCKKIQIHSEIFRFSHCLSSTSYLGSFRIEIAATATLNFSLFLFFFVERVI